MTLNGSNAHDFLTGFGHVAEVHFAPVPEPVSLETPEEMEVIEIDEPFAEEVAIR